MKNYAKLFKMSMALLMLEGLLGVSDLSAQNKLNTLKFDKTSQLRDFFSYKGDGTILVSGHRGGGLCGELYRRSGECSYPNARFL